MDTIRLPARMENLEIFRSYVLEKAADWGIVDEMLFKIELVLEELLTNVINYGYASEKGDIEVGCALSSGTRFHLLIHDWGKAFDPLARKDPDITEGIDERPIGGLGIHLVRKMVDQMSYERSNDSNVLNVYFQIPVECI